MGSGAVAEVLLSVVEAVVVDVVADEVVGGVCNHAVHNNFLAADVTRGMTHSVNCSGHLAVCPSPLGEPGVVFGVDFDVFSAGEWDFAVIAEVVFVDWQDVSWACVSVGIVGVYVAELGAFMAGADGRQEGLACVGIDGRGVECAMELAAGVPGKIACATGLLFFDEGQRVPQFLIKEFATKGTNRHEGIQLAGVLGRNFSLMPSIIEVSALVHSAVNSPFVSQLYKTEEKAIFNCQLVPAKAGIGNWQWEITLPLHN